MLTVMYMDCGRQPVNRGNIKGYVPKRSVGNGPRTHCDAAGGT